MLLARDKKSGTSFEAPDVWLWREGRERDYLPSFGFITSNSALPD
jgi:lipid A disaccharide synthetase